MRQHTGNERWYAMKVSLDSEREAAIDETFLQRDFLTRLLRVRVGRCVRRSTA